MTQRHPDLRFTPIFRILLARKNSLLTFHAVLFRSSKTIKTALQIAKGLLNKPFIINSMFFQNSVHTNQLPGLSSTFPAATPASYCCERN